MVSKMFDPLRFDCIQKIIFVIVFLYHNTYGYYLELPQKISSVVFAQLDIIIYTVCKIP